MQSSIMKKVKTFQKVDEVTKNVGNAKYLKVKLQIDFFNMILTFNLIDTSTIISICLYVFS